MKLCNLIGIMVLITALILIVFVGVQGLRLYDYLKGL